MSEASTTGEKTTAGFSPEERAAMKARAEEIRAESRKGGSKAAKDEAAVLEKIAEMAEPDRALAERVHAIVTESAPGLAPKLWYGQPAYAKGGKVVCFFRSGQVDKERYSTFGFSVEAGLDDESGLWPTSFALTHLSAEGEERIRDLVRRAVG